VKGEEKLLPTYVHGHVAKSTKVIATLGDGQNRWVIDMWSMEDNESTGVFDGGLSPRVRLAASCLLCSFNKAWRQCCIS
jgi:hypothetical protein